MSEATTSRRASNVFTTCVPGAVEAGIALSRGTDPRHSVIASASSFEIIGVAAEPRSGAGIVRTYGPHSQMDVKRDPAFTDPVVIGDVLGVGAGGKFVLGGDAAGVPGVLEVEADEPTGTADIFASLSPLAQTSALASAIIGHATRKRTLVLGEEGAGGSIAEVFAFVPGWWVIQLYDSTGKLIHNQEWTATVASQTLTVTWSATAAPAVGDVVMLDVREAP